MARKHLLKALLAGASLMVATAPAYAAPPIAYGLLNGTGTDLYLSNPDGSGKVLLYSTASKTNIGLLDMNPVANQLAIVESSANGFKVINYSSTGVRQSVNAVNDGCQTEGIDFHPTDGSLLVSEYCKSQDVQQVRRWTSSGFDPSFVVTFGSGQNNALGAVRWLGDGSGFLINYLYSDANGLHRQIQRHMIGSLSSPVSVVPLSSGNNGDFDTARCSGSNSIPCWSIVYDDGAGNFHKAHFDSMSTYDDGAQAGSTAHYSPNNSQLLYRLQSGTNWLLKVDSTTLVSKGTVRPGTDWRP